MREKNGDKFGKKEKEKKRHIKDVYFMNEFGKQ